MCHIIDNFTAYSKSLIANLKEYCRQEKSTTSPQLVYDGQSMSGFGELDVLAQNIREWG